MSARVLRPIDGIPHISGGAIGATVTGYSPLRTEPMLILTRRAGEALRIGDDIEVTVMAVNGTQVRIGIKAPRDVAVDREEIAERKRRDRDGDAVK